MRLVHRVLIPVGEFVPLCHTLSFSIHLRKESIYKLFWKALLVQELDYKRLYSQYVLNGPICKPTLCHVLYGKSSSHEPLSFKLSKMQPCIWFQQRTRTHAVISREWNDSLPSVSYYWRSFSSTVSHLRSLLHQELFWPFTPCRPLQAGRYTVLLYFSRTCTIRLKMFLFCVCLFFNVLFLWKVL